MYRGFRVGVSIPAYNEEKLIGKTVASMPEFVDCIVITNDGSKDRTLEVLTELAETDKRVVVLDNDKNRGVGYTVIRGLKENLEQGMDLIAVMAADAQCDPTYLSKMADTVLDEKVDYCKANRFMNLTALKAMSRFRRTGNIFITILNKFATGYYSVFDSQNGYGVFTRDILERMPFELIGERYDYENTMLIAMSVIDGRVKDHPVPAIYGEETSTIPLVPTMYRALKVLTAGFWRRMYYKYVIFDFHPIALFLFTGIPLMVFGTLFGLVLAYLRIFHGDSPSTGTVMLSVMPFLVGFQLALTAIILDVNHEKRA
jgi:glycosyltransferase involved in cell wall biosynthesis